MQYLLCLRLRLKPNTANPATGTAREFLGEALQELAANHQPAPELPMSSIANGENHAGSINSQNSEPHGFGRGFLNKPSHGGQNAGHPVPRQDMQEHLAQRAPSANGAGAQRMTRSTVRRIGVDSYDAGTRLDGATADTAEDGVNSGRDADPDIATAGQQEFCETGMYDSDGSLGEGSEEEWTGKQRMAAPGVKGGGSKRARISTGLVEEAQGDCLIETDVVLAAEQRRSER
jgi:hypothetical protein